MDLMCETIGLALDYYPPPLLPLASSLMEDWRPADLCCCKSLRANKGSRTRANH